MRPDIATLERAAQERRENQLQYLLSVFLRHWATILAITVACSVLWGGYTMWRDTDTMTYEARTTLGLRQSQWQKSVLKGVGGTELYPDTPAAVVARVDKRAVAESVTRAMVEQDILTGGPLASISTDDEVDARVRDMEARFTVEEEKNTGAIVIRARGESPREAQHVTELAARAFINVDQEYRTEQESVAHSSLLTSLDDLRKKLDAAESEVWKFRRDMNFRTYDQVMDDMRRLNDDLTQANAAKDEIRARLTELEDEIAEANAGLPMALGQVTSTVVKKLFDELEQLLQEQITKSVDWLPNSPPMQDLSEQIVAKKQAILAALQQQDSGTGGVNVYDAIQSLRSQYSQLQLELSSHEVRTATLEKVLSDMVEQLPALAEKDKEYKPKVREAEQLRLHFDALIAKEFDVRTAIERGVGHVAWNEPVSAGFELPGRSQRVKTWMNFLLGAIVGCVAGLAYAFTTEMNDTSIRTIEDVTQHIGVEVIGAIPRMRFGKGSRNGRRRGTFVPVPVDEQVDACVVTQHDPKSPISEAYRTLRTNFQLTTLQAKPRTIMITSAVPGEGKTTTAVNLAVTMADSGMRVLLIDTDMRRPHVHHVLKLQRGPGLADVLRDGLDYRSVIRKTRIENLSIISAGRVPPNPSELIGSERMRGLMKRLGGEFDVVICDAPSLLVVTDPVLLGRELDMVILVVSVNNVRRETVMRAKKHLDTAQAKLAGVVLNGLEATRRHYYYYYYYYDDSATRRSRRWINT